MTAPRPLHDRALDNLQFIRSTMERAGSFTAVPGWGMVVVGCTALAATWLAVRQSRDTDWLAVWLGEAVLGVVVGGAAMVQKARAANDPLLSGPARRFGLSFLPPIVVGALLTIALHRAGLFALMPGVWLLLYGTAVATAGDRKSTRLNSSHSQISYAVFCLKKKNEHACSFFHYPERNTGIDNAVFIRAANYDEGSHL